MVSIGIDSKKEPDVVSTGIPDLKVPTDDLAEPPVQQETYTSWGFVRNKRQKVDPDAIATVRSVFDNPDLAQFYHPKPEYENYRAFDPNERWTHREEQAVRRKVDIRIFIWVLVMFFALNIDRGNLGLATADGLVDDLGINTNDYNNAQNMYRVGFLIAELPSQMIGKKIGTDRWIPTQIILWSIASGGQFFMTNRATFFACRFFIGLAMGGYIPDALLYLSYFYKNSEMPMRLAIFWFVNSMSSVIASFIAYGVFNLRGVGGREGWRWLFLIEAIISVTIGFLSFLFMVPGPTQTKSWWKPTGYFTEREEKIIVNRVLRDDPSKADMHNREGITPAMLWKSLKDYDLWPIYAIGILFQMPGDPPGQYLNLSLKAIGYDRFTTTLLNIPVTVAASCTMLGITFLTEYFHQISLFGLISQLWSLPFLVVIYTSAQRLSNWSLYAVLFMLLASPSVHAAQVSWCSRISNSVRTRAVSAAVYNIMVQLSGIASSNIYRKDDNPPWYPRGNQNLIAINVAVIVLYVLTKAYYVWRNKQKERHWNAMSIEEQQQYLIDNADRGNKRLDFRFDC
ncbi:putative transporter [Colletotrichum siamense]|uniref:Transporter n=1 Tax=Colletotrichum siamense TaxID=690259 RepID=A0A9P5EE58_COLSI|nr:putative transporter [Colletotrichum siamense]KAF4849286.1 putative transporter [Colletotrichum siamense]